MSNVYNKYRRYILLFGAFLIQFTLGHFYTFGNNQVMIVDYMRNYSISKLDVNMRNSVWIIGMMYFGVGAAVSFGGYIEMKIGAAETVLLGSWFMSLNVCLMYFTMRSYLAVVVVTYGLFSGIGIGMAYGVSLAAPVKCFKHNKGLIIGITVSGFGLSSTIFNILEDYLFMKYEKSYFEKLPDIFVISGLIYAILQFFGSMLMIIKSNKLESNENNSDSYSEDSSQIVLYQRDSIEMKPHEIIFKSSFWIVWLIVFFHSTCVNFIISIYNRYSTFLQLKTEVVFVHLTKLSIYHGICNFFGRIILGFIIDRIPLKTTMLIIFITNSIFVLTLPLLALFKEQWNYYGFGIWFGILYFFFSGNNTVFPIICIKLFGMKNFVCNYGLIYTACSGSGTISSLIIMTVSPNHSFSETLFRNIFIIGGVLSFLAAMLTLLIRGEPLNSELQ